MGSKLYICEKSGVYSIQSVERRGSITYIVRNFAFVLGTDKYMDMPQPICLRRKKRKTNSLCCAPYPKSIYLDNDKFGAEVLYFVDNLQWQVGSYNKINNICTINLTKTGCQNIHPQTHKEDGKLTFAIVQLKNASCCSPWATTKVNFDTPEAVDGLVPSCPQSININCVKITSAFIWP